MSALSPLRQVAQLLAQRGLKIPPKLRRGIAAAERAPEAAHPRLVAAIAEQIPALAPLVDYEGPLCPSYPRAHDPAAARLALGEAPAKVLKGLTPREAHLALSLGVCSPVAWILRDLPGHVLAHGSLSVPVARWIAACWADPPRRAALETERVERIAGAEVHGRLLDRLDEIMPADLANGPATGVQPAFEAAARRLYAAWEESAKDDDRALAPMPRWWKPIRCAHLLLTRKALCAEGKTMRHCVGTYAPHVAAKRCVILAIAVKVGDMVVRSTAEIDPSTREVRQHKGVGNKAPPELCVRALAVCLRRWS